MASGAGGTGGGIGGSGGVSASLTPAIWEKTIPYDGETFHLEYMDLDEFLLENGIPVSLEEEELQRTLTSVEGKGKPMPKLPELVAAVTSTPAAPEVDVPVSTQNPSPSVSPSTATSDPEEPITVTTLQPAKLEEEEEQEGQEEEDKALPVEATAEQEVKKKGKQQQMQFRFTHFLNVLGLEEYKTVAITLHLFLL